MNVITILADTLRYDYMGFNGNQMVKTPNMDKLARKSVVFDQAYMGSYPCMPARRDLWTGKYEFPFRGWGPLEHNDKDIGKVVSVENGLTSMLITDHFHLWEKGSGNYHFDFSGHEFVRGQEYDKWKTDMDSVVYPANKDKLAGHCGNPKEFFERNRRNGAFRNTEEDYFPAVIMSKAGQWVEKNRNHKDFFLMIDCFDPHEPFDPPQHYTDMYNPDYTGEEVIWPTYGWNQLSAEETKHVQALYAAEVTMTDRWIGHFIDKLEQLQLMDDTMIILTSDHGHLFGEHNLMGKPWSAISDSNLYQELCHIPLFIYYPKSPNAGKRVSHLVQLPDLYPTILEGLGIKPPLDIHGKSLMPYVIEEEEQPPVREYAFYGRFGEAFNVTDGAWTLFIWPSGKDNSPLYWYSQLPPQYGAAAATGSYEDGRYPVECARGNQTSALYHISEDPSQKHNLIDEKPEIVQRLMKAASLFLHEINAPKEQWMRLGLSSHQEVIE